MTILHYILIGLGAFAAGAVNALAGGGTLITFPLLTVLGIPAVTANVTNTVALCPGYFGATFAQRKDLQDQKSRLWWLLPAGLLGGLAGALLLRSRRKPHFEPVAAHMGWLLVLGALAAGMLADAAAAPWAGWASALLVVGGVLAWRAVRARRFWLFAIGLVLFALSFVVNLTADLVVKGVGNEARD